MPRIGYRPAMPNTTTRLAVAALAAFGALSKAAAAEPACSAEAVKQAAADIAAPRDIVQAAAANNDLDTDLSPATSTAIVTLKQKLVALVDAQVACMTADAKQLEATLNASAMPAGKNAKPDDAPIRFSAVVFDDNPLLSVVAQIGIPCGSDALWLVYAQDGTHRRRVLTWTSPRYDRIDGAWDSFQVAVSPRDAEGRWFAAAASIRPWCTSTWSVIDYAILRPGADADKPSLVLKSHDSLWWGGDDTGRLSVDAKHVELRFHGASIDTGVHNREYVRRYAVNGSTATRVAPVAGSARDFVEEWIVSPWPLAQQWTEQKQAATLRKAHESLQAERKRYEPVEFGATTTCTNAANTTQIELRHDDGDRSTFFRVTGTSDYVMAAIAAEGDPACGEAVPAVDDVSSVGTEQR